MVSILKKLVILKVILLFMPVAGTSTASAETDLKCKSILHRYDTLTDKHENLPKSSDLIPKDDLEQLKEGKVRNIQIYDGGVMMAHIVCDEKEEFLYAELYFDSQSQNSENVRADLEQFDILAKGLLSSISGLNWEQQSLKYAGYIESLQHQIDETLITTKFPEARVLDKFDVFELKMVYFNMGPTVILKENSAVIP